jgi:uncharacterized protein (TIRG00374 family)
MTERKVEVSPRMVLYFFFGLLFFIAYLYFFVDIPEMVDALTNAGGNIFFYLLAATVSVLNITLYSISWHLLLKLTSVKSVLKKVFLFIWTSIFVDFIIPFESVSGDIVKIYLMARETGEKAGKIAASVMGNRILSMAVTIGGLLFGSVFLTVSFTLPPSVLFVIWFEIIGSVASLVIICYLIFFEEEKTWKAVSMLLNFFVWLFRGRWSLSKIKTRLHVILQDFHRNMEVFSKNPKWLFRPLMLLIIAWFFDISTMFLVFYAIGFNVSFLAVVVVYSLMLAVQAIPFGIPSELGFIEIVMASLFTAFGVPSGTSAAATVLTRILTFWSRIIIGYVAAQWVGLKTFQEPSSVL